MPRLRGIGRPVAALLLTAAWLAGCGGAEPVAPTWRVQVLGTLPHDPTMFTQGLEIHGDTLYESSGLVGHSRVRAVALHAAARPVEAALPMPLFGEGITVARGRLWQLTWQNGIAVERDPVTLAERGRVRYRGEGWGLCYDGTRLVMSDGTDRLTFRDPVTFAPTGTVAVRLDGRPLAALNELECAGGNVWANVWMSERIARIDPRSGQVTAMVDAAGLLTPAQRADADVLNGIAAIPGTDQFLVTGKDWPTVFRVRFVPSEDESGP